ncbi:hypothetical protein [Neobacillus mesonae]|uniref:hypothetical protein n=1 Tax=Neobacillus mesonae TaxID=1193713 RepID=UPI00203F11D9|nr:hypothetical protein [Neobacillus mesonae]MCM3567826.1 hypothetical protein [Neobacillus mesonae]
MNLGTIYTNSLLKSIENISKSTTKSEHDKYVDVCVQFANIMTILVPRQDEISLVDLQMINNVFKQYQDNYLNIED